MTRSMLSLGTLLALALAMASRSLELEAGSGPPSLTATEISRPHLVKILAFAPSVLSFLRLMLFHLECPDLVCPPFSYFGSPGGVGSQGPSRSSISKMAAMSSFSRAVSPFKSR